MRDTLLVLGAEVQSGRAIAKKLRFEHYDCQLFRSGTELSAIEALSPAGIILAGENEEGAVMPDMSILTLGVPVLAIGSPARSLLSRIGAPKDNLSVVNSVVPVAYQESRLFKQVAAGDRWVARAENYCVPEPFRITAEGGGLPLAFEDDAKGVYLLQFQIERNDPDGMAMLLSFAGDICGQKPLWTMERMIAEAEQTIRDAVGDGEAICALSGGLDSTVAAMLAKRALCDRVRCVFVDTGLLRKGEAEESEHRFIDELCLNCRRMNVSAQVMQALRGLTCTQDKWHMVEREINGALEAVAKETPGEKVFVKGTHFVDVIGIHSNEHDQPFKLLVEPLRKLFKEEIRAIGEYLSLPIEVLNRQSFPGMGFAARIEGEVTEERLSLLRSAHAIFVDSLKAAGLDKRLTRFFVMLNQLGGQNAVVLRAMQGAEATISVARLPYDMLERTVERIRAELPNVGRVLLDVTQGKEEWSFL